MVVLGKVLMQVVLLVVEVDKLPEQEGIPCEVLALLLLLGQELLLVLVVLQLKPLLLLLVMGEAKRPHIHTDSA